MKKLIELLNESFEDGYLKIDPKNPLYSQGNILEWTGQLLVFLEDEELILRIVEGLKENEVVEGLVPRTVYKGADDPHIVAEETKKDIWEEVPKVIHISEVPVWYRTDVSYSQFTFLAIGLWSVCERYKVSSNIFNKLSNDLLANMIGRLACNNWVIKRIDGQPARQGRFHPFGNVGLRMILLQKITEDLTDVPILKVNWFIKHFLRLMLSIMKKRKLNIDSEDDRNTAFLLYFLDEKTDHVKDFFMKYYMSLTTNLNDEHEVIGKIDVDNLSTEQQINVYVVRYMLQQMYPHFLDVSDKVLEEEMKNETNKL